jgi:hypothetical protein
MQLACSKHVGYTNQNTDHFIGIIIIVIIIVMNIETLPHDQKISSWKQQERLDFI